MMILFLAKLWFLVLSLLLRMSGNDEDCEILDYCSETQEYSYVDDSDGNDVNESVCDWTLTSLDFDPNSE